MTEKGIATCQAFEVNCAPETLRRTDLGDLSKGDLVNLERRGRGFAE